MGQPFNQQMDFAEWMGVIEPCPHTGGVDDEGQSGCLAGKSQVQQQRRGALMELNTFAIDMAANYLRERSQGIGQPSELLLSAQLHKLQEEVGEASSELHEMLTAPTFREAVTRTGPLMNELCDVAISALVALSLVVGGDEWPDYLAGRITFCTDRLVNQ